MVPSHSGAANKRYLKKLNLGTSMKAFKNIMFWMTYRNCYCIVIILKNYKLIFNDLKRI